jgi:hypothetical protein
VEEDAKGYASSSYDNRLQALTNLKQLFADYS